MKTAKHKYFLLLWALISLSALLACGLLSGESTVEPTPTVIMEESGESESVESPSEVEPPADEAEQLSDELQEPETESPPVEDAASSDEDESTLESEHSADPGEGWGESNTPAQSACDNPYFPMRQGATWEFKDTEGFDAVWTITEVTGDLDHATSTMEIVTEGVTLTYHWECEAGGSIVSYDYAGLTADTGDVELSMNVVEGSGEFLPALDDLQVGYTWELTMKSVMSFTMDVEGLDSEMLGTIAISQTHEIVGEEPVTIGDVTADGVQVEVDMISTVIMEMTAISVPPQTTEMKESLWLGYGIGLVREETISEFGNVDLELQSFYIP